MKQRHIAGRVTLGAMTALLVSVLSMHGQGKPAKAAAPMVVLPPLSGSVPLAIPKHPTGLSPEQARPFFDIFSWESFIALNWPADPQHRGQPLQPGDPEEFLKAKNGTRVVWGSYKEAFELYSEKDPTPWNSYKIPDSPCGAGSSSHLLVRVSKTSNLLDEINQAFSYPLIDQNKNYAEYEVRFNETQYNFIRDNQYYLLKNLVKAEMKGFQMPASKPPATYGALMAKAAWRLMVPGDPVNRYYVTRAQVYDPFDKTCHGETVGLVGFHIVQKLANFPEWIWSTFEQVDNVQRGPRSTPATPVSFNNGTDNPQTIGGWANRPPLQSPGLQPKDKRVPVQVTRFNPIPAAPAGNSTVDLNARYQRRLQSTVWANYELVFTQWPSDPSNFKLMENGGLYPQNSGAAFPADSVTNAAIETFFQSPNDAAGAGGGGNSCMGCHYRAGQADFSWSLMNRAHE